MLPRIMLVDDDRNNLNAMRRILRIDFDVEAFVEPSEALKRGEEIAFDVVVADYRMPEMDGVRFLQAFREIQPDAYRIVASAYDDVELFKNAINRAQIHRYLEKPVDGMRLVQAIAEGASQVALGHRVEDLESELAAARQRLERCTELLRSIAHAHPEVLPEGWEEP